MTKTMEAPTKPAGEKLTLPLSALQKAMATVAPAVQRKTTIPMLSNVRITPTDGVVEFAATNLELSIRATVTGGSLEYDRPFVVPALKLEAFSRLLDGKDVSIKLVGDNLQRAELRCGRSVTRMPANSITGFPALTFGGHEGIELTQEVAERMLEFTAFALADNFESHVIPGALLEISNGRLALVATDGHRLARYSVSTDEDAATMILPGAFIEAMRRTIDAGSPAHLVLSEQAECVHATIGDKTGEIALTHRKLTGKFPNYKAILPPSFVASIKVDAGAMSAAIRRCLMFVDERSFAVIFSIGLQEIALKGTCIDSGETSETVEVRSASTAADFAPFTIGFSGKYLLDAFSRLEGEVEMRFSALNGTNAMMIYAQPEDGETFEYIVMPMRV